MRQYSDEFINSLSDEQKVMLLQSIAVEGHQEYEPATALKPEDIKVPKDRRRKPRKKKSKVNKDFTVERDTTYAGGSKIRPMSNSFVDPGGHRGKENKTPDYVPEERTKKQRRTFKEVRCSICGTIFEKDSSLIYSGGIYHRCDKCSGT